MITFMSLLGVGNMLLGYLHWRHTNRFVSLVCYFGAAWAFVWVGRHLPW